MYSGYGNFKSAVAEACVEEIRPIQQRFNEIIKDKAFLEQSMKEGYEKANNMANKTLFKVKRKIGMI